MSDLGRVSNLKWADFEKHFGEEQIKKLFADVDIFAAIQPVRGAAEQTKGFAVENSRLQSGGLLAKQADSKGDAVLLQMSDYIGAVHG